MGNSQKIKLFEQFIREFVENSELSYEDIKMAESDVNTLIESINEYFLIEDDDMDSDIKKEYDALLEINVFSEINNILNQYYDDGNTGFYSNLQRCSHLLKEMSEQYNYGNVEYAHKDIDVSIDKLVNDLNSILPFALKKLGVGDKAQIQTQDEMIPKEVEVMESIKESIKNIKK